jgi:ligand-binding sensor domain-containing protein/DNA-binding CsgD family transcriptional regulator
MNKISRWVLILCFVSSFAFSQNKNLFFTHISQNEGFPNVPVNCILQDRYGYLWLGTTEGLFKYNGYTFTRYGFSAKDSTTISDNFINCIVEASDGDLLIGTNGRGLCIYHRDKNRFERFSHRDSVSTSLINNTVKAILQDSRGNVWVGTLGGGIDIFNKQEKTFRHLTPPGSAHSEIHVSSFAEDKNGNVWIGRYKGDLCYYKYVQDEFVYITEPAPGALQIEGYLKYLFVDSNNELWIGSNSAGLYRYNINTRQIRHYTQGNSSLSSNIVTAVQELEPGIIAIGTNGAGLELLHTGTGEFEHYQYALTNKTAINSNAIYSILIDTEKNLWLGTARDGLNLSSKNVEKFDFFTVRTNGSDGLSQKSVLALLPLDNETLLIGTDGGGLNVYNRQKRSFQYFRHEQSNKKSVGGNVVKSLFKDSQQNIWIGTYGNGIDQYDSKSGNFYHNAEIPGIPDRIKDANIWSIVEDHDQSIWMGTLGGGLFRYNLKTKQFSQYINVIEKPGSISHFQIMCTLVDSKGRLWIGTEDAGLDRYNPEHDDFIHYRNDPKNPNSIPSDFIRTLFENAQGELCIGTEDSGLIILKEDGTFVSFDADDGLASNTVYSILEDNRHDLWLGTTKGLSKVNLQTSGIKNYSAFNNVQGDLFNMSACLKAEDGTLFFGGINGFNEINPNDIDIRVTDPHVEITDFRIFNKSIKVNEVVEGQVVLDKSLELVSSLNLSYKHKTISLEFAAIDYANPQMIRYRYKLEGFDHDCATVDAARRTVTYTNLPGGKYTFMVMATDHNGNWSKQVRSLVIRVSPPFWSTLWFRFLVFVVFVSLVILWYRGRILKRERKLKKERLLAEQEVIKLQKENLEVTLANQNSKLTTSILHMGHKNKILQSLKQELENFTPSIDSSVKSKFLKVIKSVEREITDDENWQQLEMQLNEAHHQFIKRLRDKHPDLTNSNLQFCLFIRLNVNTKEIADIMNITVRGVEKSRYRLRKKLGLSSTDSITDYLLSL